MKKIIILIIFLNISCATKGQVFNLYNNPNYGSVPNAYYKDINNFLNQFEGTWRFQQGAEQLEIKLRKKEMMLQNPGPYQIYEDVLIGEYKYLNAAGVEKVNSLPNFTVEHLKDTDYNLYSGPKLQNSSYPICNQCPTGTERLYMFFDEPANDDIGLGAILILKHVTESGVEKLYINFIHKSSAANMHKSNIDLPSVFRDFSLPYGEYVLIKQ